MFTNPAPLLTPRFRGKGGEENPQRPWDREGGAEEEPVENSVERTRKESARKADAVSRRRDTGTERPRQPVGRGRWT